MKNKKFLKIGAAVLLSGVLLMATALSGYASDNAYEQLKALLREEQVQHSNLTIHMDLGISDNGTQVFRATGGFKADKDAENMSGQLQVTANEDEKVIDFYQKDDTVLFHLAGSENWYQTTSPEKNSDDEYGTRKRFNKDDMKDNQQLREALMDTMMGDLKDQVLLTESNGLRTFALTLDKSNMPVLIQTAFSVSNRDCETEVPEAFDMANLPTELQDVISDMKNYHNLIDISGEKTLEKIMISLTVDQQNQPQAMDLSTSISGIGKDGSAHVYEMNCSMVLSDLNTTVPDEANINTATIIKVDSTQFENRRNRPMMRR